MSIPTGGMSIQFMSSALPEPDASGRADFKVDYELGGAGIGDPSGGLMTSIWRLRVVGPQVLLAKEPYTTEVELFQLAGITEASLAFDQNMRPTVCYMVGGVAKLWWFDSSVQAQVTTDIGSGVVSPFLTLDDKRDMAGGYSDILLLYLNGNALCYRQQRDRFSVERTLKTFDGIAVRILAAGMDKALRMHVEVQMSA